MAVNFASAIEAFNKASQLTGSAGMEPRESLPGGSFAGMVRELAEQAVESGQKAEGVTAKAVQGNADLTEVVAALTNAEVTVQTVVAVRDRIITAYQEIMRMPI